MFHMPDSYYDPPDNDYTPLQEKHIESGLWDPDEMDWDEYILHCYDDDDRNFEDDDY